MKFVVSSNSLLKQLSALNGIVSTNQENDYLEDDFTSLESQPLTFNSDVVFHNGGSPSKKRESARTDVPDEGEYYPRATKNPPFTPFQVDQLRTILEPLIADIVQQIASPATPHAPSIYLCGVSQVSEHFGIPEGTIRKHIKDIKHSKRGKRLYFKVQDVSDWIDEGQRATRDEVATATREYFESRQKIS